MTRHLNILLIIMSLCLGGCAFLGGSPVAAPEPIQAIRLNEAREVAKQGRFSDAIEAYKKVQQDNPGTEWAALAQFGIATVYVHPDNPQKDLSQALAEFDDFISHYPSNSRIDEARSWRSVLKVALESKKENDRLSKSIEQLKQLDVRQEEKRRRK